MKNILMVDYENIQGLTLEKLDPNSVDVWFFVGKSQNKIPFDLVESTQPFGSSLRWIKIEGNGKNKPKQEDLYRHQREETPAPTAAFRVEGRTRNAFRWGLAPEH